MHCCGLGWPDWANFRLLCANLLLVVFTQVARIFGLPFSQKSFVWLLAINGVGFISGRFFSQTHLVTLAMSVVWKRRQLASESPDLSTTHIPQDTDWCLVHLPVAGCLYGLLFWDVIGAFDRNTSMYFKLFVSVFGAVLFGLIWKLVKLILKQDWLCKSTRFCTSQCQESC
jgi:hypothetical protein